MRLNGVDEPELGYRKMLREPMRPGAVLLALVLVTVVPLRAANPPSGTLSPANPVVTYTYGPNFVSNPSSDSAGGVCGNPAPPCDHFALTFDLPADFKTTNPNATIRIETTFPAGEDYDVYLMNADESAVEAMDAQGNNPELINIAAGEGFSEHSIRIIPFAVAGSTATTTITLIMPPPPPPDEDEDGVPDAEDACPGTPPGAPVDSTGCEITGPPGEQCDVPGTELFADPDEDHTAPDGSQAYDIRSLKVAEQNFSTGRELVFTLKVDSLAAWPSTSSRWIVPFKGADNNYYYLEMLKFADTSAPQFQYGTTNAAGNPGCFAELGPLDVKSKFDADGTITLVIGAATVGGLEAGQSLTEITARAQALNGTSVVCGTSTSYDTAGPADFTASASCPVIVKPPQPVATGLPPRFYGFESPEARADSAGEPTIGYNPATKNAMFIAGTEVDRITFAEHAADDGLVDAAGNALPESCAPLWQDKSYAGAVNTLDPILETEQISGRTFQSSLSGANSIFAFSDDDGDTWIPAQAGPPNGGVDHQTVGVGPWAPGAKPPSATEDYAIYYCSQSVAAAFCSRSDNGGVSFGPGINFRDTLTDCNNTLGGLHGHVQVARNDGTVYVPFGNCGTKVGVAVSTDSGITWGVRTIPQSSAGDDPGLGIANDGTAYMCYAEGGAGRIFASVSSDRGNSWTGHYDLGAAVGVKHAVFATAVAGDGDRAACAFLGTADEGNPESESFQGVWYPYVATTYDGGVSWHTVNVSPNDPVQGWGGICLSGVSCGSNRNLLDFNDIIMDDQGRLLFAYADGCRGTCVQDPTKNTFSDNGVVARQSGGRTLLAALDDTAQFNSATPVAPGAACARADLSLRTAFETRVAWSPPDDGGSPVLNYKVYRGLAAAGPFDFVADAGPKHYLIDPTAEGTVEKYYYKVVAENAQGAAPESNVIELPITVPEVETSCTLPGVTVVREGSAGECAQDGCTPQTDIQSLHVAELDNIPDQIVVTMKMASLAPAPAPGTHWFVLSKKQNGDNLYLAMDTSSGTPEYTYGTYAVGTLTTFTPQGSLDPASSFETDGSIHLVADRSLFGGLDAGNVIPSLEGRTRAGDSAAPSRDVLGPGDYTVRGTRVCLPNTPPVAALRATPQFGSSPLSVTFDGSESYDNDVDVPDTIQTWVINFGDGTGASAEAGETPVWQHNYANPGVYSAQLRVTDSRGLQSENAAEKVIQVEVLEPATVTGSDAGNNRLGGSLAAGSLLALALLGLMRRRRAGPRA